MTVMCPSVTCSQNSVERMRVALFSLRPLRESRALVGISSQELWAALWNAAAGRVQSVFFAMERIGILPTDKIFHEACGMFLGGHSKHNSRRTSAEYQR